jgi:hypothetical protein
MFTAGGVVRHGESIPMMSITTSGRGEAMSEHTPGPWEAREGWEEVYGPAVYTAGAHETQPLAAVHEVGNPNAKADARLIAAAPDLLAALDHLSGHASTTYHMCGTDEEWMEGLRAARAAIAKATGEKEKSAPAPSVRKGAQD